MLPPLLVHKSPDLAVRLGLAASSTKLLISEKPKMAPPLPPDTTPLSSTASVSTTMSSAVNPPTSSTSISGPLILEFSALSDAPTESFRSPPKRKLDEEYVSVSIGTNVLQIEYNDTMDIFAASTNTLLVEGSYWQQQGPVSYVGLMKSDPFIKLVRSFSMELFKSDEFAQYVQAKKKPARRRADGSPSSATSGSVTTAGDEMKSEHLEHVFEGKGEDETSESSEAEADIVSEDALIVTKIQATQGKGNEKSSGIRPNTFPALPGVQSLHGIHQSKDEYYRFVEMHVLQILPNKHGMHNAVGRFFKYVMPFVSIFDEQTFMSEVKTLFHGDFPSSGEDYYTLFSIRNETSLNLAGQLLLMVRLGYMTLIPNNESDTIYTLREQALIKDITRFKSDHYLGVVHLCVPEEKVQTKSSFKVVQSLVLLYYYRSVAPNDCLGLSGSDSQLLFGAIVNHALCIGLNRDPLTYSTINSISKEPAFVNTWRALWHYIVTLDALCAMYCGTPLKVATLDISDVETPCFDSFSPQVGEFHEQLQAVCSSYRRIVNRITSLQSMPRVIEILQETNHLEKVFLDIFGKDFFRDYICCPAPAQTDSLDAPDRLSHEESYMKVNRFLTFIHMRANLSCLYYLIAMHYEDKLDKDETAEIGAGIELFKIFIRSVVQLVYIMSYALDNSMELFGNPYDFILTSGIERSMIKTHNFITSFFIRLVNYKRTLAVKEMNNPGEAAAADENFELRMEVTDSFFTIALIEAELFVGNFRVLSKTYINSYKIYVMAYFVLKQCMENPEKLFAGVVNNKRYFHEGTNLIQFLSIPELESLCKLCEEFKVAKLELLRRQKTHSKAAQTPFHKPQEKPSATSTGFAGDTIPSAMNEVAPVLPEAMDTHSDTSFDAATANRAMYANENTVNTYGMLQEKHMYSDFSKEVFDEQSMIGNAELMKLFELYGDYDT